MDISVNKHSVGSFGSESPDRLATLQSALESTTTVPCTAVRRLLTNKHQKLKSIVPNKCRVGKGPTVNNVKILTIYKPPPSRFKLYFCKSNPFGRKTLPLTSKLSGRSGVKQSETKHGALH